MEIKLNFDSVTIAPAIELYEDILDNPEDIIEFALTKDNWKESTMGAENRIDTDYRDSKILHIPYGLDSEVIWFVLAKILNAAGQHYAEKWDTGPCYMENPQLLHYAAGSGHYDEHHDAGPGHPRVFSAVLYLNDVEDGGETYFKYFDFKVKPKAGNLIIFPADYAYTHAALPPISGDKFAIVTWYLRHNIVHHHNH